MNRGSSRASWRRFHRHALHVGLLVLGTVSAWSEEVAKSSEPSRRAKPRTHYLGRPIAQTMHWSGADWLLRATREEEEHASAMLDALNVQRGDTVCDLGCGVGYHSLRLAGLVGPEGRVYGVDIQSEMLSMLEKRAEEAGIKHITPVAGKTEALDLPARSCDLVLLVDVYHELSHPEEMLRDIRRVLKPEGRVVFVEFRAEDPDVPIKTLHKMSKRQLLKEVIPQGFRLVQDEDDLPWQHLMGFRPASIDPLRVLFVRNSYLRPRNLLGLVRDLAGMDTPKRRFDVAFENWSGFHDLGSWDRSRAATKIAAGGWDFVVLEERSPFLPRTEFSAEPVMERAREFRGKVETATSRFVVLMEPVFRALRTRSDLVERQASTYRRIGDELRAPVAPVALAWFEASRRRGDIALYREDGHHPTPAGAYLTACVVYSTLTGRAPPPPEGDPPVGLEPDDAAFLRAVAWLSLQHEPVYITDARERGETIPRQSPESLGVDAPVK